MYILRPDEKTTHVMLYTKETVVRGEVVTKEIVHRVSIWPRTDGIPKYMHLLKAQVVLFGGGSGKTLSYPEMFFPVAELIAFHTLPPVEEPLDYDLAEANRMMVDVDMMVGTFVMKGKNPYFHPDRDWSQPRGGPRFVDVNLRGGDHQSLSPANAAYERVPGAG